MIRRTIWTCGLILIGLQHSSLGDEGDAFDELYDVLMIRRALNGDSYGENEISPIIFKFSAFPFDDATFPRLKTALNNMTAENIKALSHPQRAVLQRQLWAVFDATTPSRFRTGRSHQKHRDAVRSQLADLIRKLALSRSEIEALPSTLPATVRSKKYPSKFTIESPFQPFLPPELSDNSSGWICFGRRSSPVTFHARDNRWRSAFFQFIRLPKGRQASIDYLRHWKKENAFPAGTQVALIEQAFLISNDGAIVLSPLTASIQLRAFRNVEEHVREAESTTQCVAEFISRPRDYANGNALLTAVQSSDFRLKVLTAGGKNDLLDLVKDPTVSVLPRLQQCMNCHGGAGTNSLGDVVVPRGELKSLQQRSRAEIAEATARAKQEDSSWQLLQAALEE